MVIIFPFHYSTICVISPRENGSVGLYESVAGKLRFLQVFLSMPKSIERQVRGLVVK